MAGLREEFRCSKLNLRHNDKEVFYTSQWGSCPPWLFLAIRLVLAVYFVVWLVHTVYKWPPNDHRMFIIYLTSWTLIVVTLYLVVAALVAVYFYADQGDRRYNRRYTPTSEANKEISDTELPTSYLLQFQWLLFNVALTMSTVVLLAYWPIVYKPPLTDTKFNNHAMTVVILLLDLFISRLPYRLLHAYIPMVFVLLYGIFNFLYYKFGGTDWKGNRYIYSILDWRDPLWTSLALLGSVFVAVPITHCLLFFLYKVKVCIHDRCGNAASTPGRYHVTQHGSGAVLVKMTEKEMPEDV